MQPPVYCPTHIYTLVVMLNETESYQQLFTPSDSIIVANVSPDYLQDNTLLNLKVLVGNTFSDNFYESGITNLCK